MGYEPQISQRDSYRRSSIAKGQRHAVFRFSHLPAELRQYIIELSLPTVNDVARPWPAPIPSLLATSKQTNAETREVLSRWSPIHYVPDPDSLHLIPSPGLVKVETICLSMFHDAKVGVLRSGPLTRSLANDHQDLVVSWMEHIAKLPMYNTIDAVIIDATPAPGWMRYEKPTWVNNIINDRTVSARFIYEHTAVIADLISAIAERFQSLNHDISVELAGQYGQDSDRFPAFIQSRCRATSNLNVSFTGDIVPDDNFHRTPMTVEHGIAELYSIRNTPAGRYKKEKHILSSAKRRLQQYDFTPSSDFLFANCFEDSAYWTMHQLKRMTTLVLDDHRRSTYVDISIADCAQHYLISSLAKDLRLSTSLRSSWRRQKIRVFRKSAKARGAADIGPNANKHQSSSLLSLLLVSAAVVLVIGIIHNNHKRRKGH